MIKLSQDGFSVTISIYDKELCLFVSGKCQKMQRQNIHWHTPQLAPSFVQIEDRS